MRFLLSFLLIPTFLNAYVFNSAFFGFEGGYRQDEMNWSFSDPRIPRKNAIKEQIDNIHIWEIGIQGKYMESMMPYFRTRALYGFSWSHDGKLSLVKEARSSDFALTAIIDNEGTYDVSGHLWDSKTALGYAYRFGPITFAPLLGFAYEAERFNRCSEPSFSFNNNNQTNPIVATTGAKKSLKFDFYAPLVGIDLIFQIGPGSRVQIHTGYEYLFGRFYSYSSYFMNSDVTQTNPTTTTIRNEKTDIRVSRFAYGNVFHLSALIGILSELTLGLNFEYESRKAKVGRSTQTIHGTQTVTTGGVATKTPIQEVVSHPFQGLFWQSFSGTVDLSWAF